MGDVIDAGDVVTTRDLVLAFLTPLASRDWTAPVPDLEWNCDMTLRHMIRAQSIYAAHLATRATRRLPMSRELDPGLEIDALLDNLRTQVSVLAAVIRDAPPEARAWHNSGMTDPSAYCAMACDELIVHTWDIGRGLGEQFDLPAAVCARLVRGSSRCGRRSKLILAMRFCGATVGSHCPIARGRAKTGDGGRDRSRIGTGPTRTRRAHLSRLANICLV